MDNESLFRSKFATKSGKQGDGAPLVAERSRRQPGRLFSARMYKIRDLLTMFAPTSTCARGARPCTRSPINAVRRGEGPFRRRRPSPRDPAEIFYSRRFLRADISSIDRAPTGLPSRARPKTPRPPRPRCPTGSRKPPSPIPITHVPRLAISA